jgi:hypothetical protein
VIDVDFGRKYYGSIPATAMGRKLESPDVITDPEPD